MILLLGLTAASGFSGCWVCSILSMLAINPLNFSEPLHTMPNDWSRLISEHDLWAYASGMITFLRDSLASERRAHAETRTAARARTALLEAQIARRDAELEACLFHTGQTFPRASGSRHAPPNIPVLSPSPPPIPTADVDNALHLTVAQNVALEEELEHLAVVVLLSLFSAPG
jgi:hypothetical protein